MPVALRTIILVCRCHCFCRCRKSDNSTVCKNNASGKFIILGFSSWIVFLLCSMPSAEYSVFSVPRFSAASRHLARKSSLLWQGYKRKQPPLIVAVFFVTNEINRDYTVDHHFFGGFIVLIPIKAITHID